MIAVALLVACAPHVDVDPPGDGAVAGTGAVVTTTDFSVGALATVALDDLAVADAVAPTSSDPLVRLDGGFVVQLNAYQADFVRIYDPGSFTVPRAEFALDRGANPHDAVLRDDRVLISLYERDWLDVRTPGGAPLGVVDLSAWDDADGLPEASTFAWVDGALLLALERLDRTAGWTSSGGRVLVVDPVGLAIVDAVPTGPSPVLRDRPSEPGAVMVVTGTFVRTADWYVPALDGGLDVLDVATGALRPVLRDADLGALVSGYAERDDGRAALLLDPGDRTWRVACLDPDSGVVTTAYQTDAWLADVRVDPLGRAWVAERATGGGSGLRIVDLDACAPVDFVPTLLPPYRVAFY